MVLRQTATAMPEAKRSFEPFEGGTPEPPKLWLRGRCLPYVRDQRCDLLRVEGKYDGPEKSRTPSG